MQIITHRQLETSYVSELERNLPASNTDHAKPPLCGWKAEQQLSLQNVSAYKPSVILP